MALKLSDFWTWHGRVGRAKYAVLGVSLFLIKHNLDRVVATAMGKSWGLLNYVVYEEGGVLPLKWDNAVLYAVLAVLALPFIWIGVVLTIRRLRDAGLALWLVILFFVPFINLIFFIALCIVPSIPDDSLRGIPFGLKFRLMLSRVIPESEFGSAVVGILMTVVLALLFAILSIYVLGQYGWSLFIGIPFFLGLNSVLIYGFYQPRPLGKCIPVALLSVLVVGVVIFLIAIEGLICLLMAAPLATVMAVLGGIIGYLLQRRESSAPAQVFPALLLLLPGSIALEPLALREPPRYEVRTSTVIDADRATVWKHVVSFSELPPPSEHLFRTGVAYPIRAEIEGQGVGATRHCVFSTGAFVEPITVWDEPRLLKFSVRSQPPVMKEWSIYNLRPPHVENYLVSREGQFLLTTLPDGRTLIEGTTVYQNRIWPGPYWRLWSDYIIHRIHTRVLDHIKNLSEKKMEP